MIEYPFMETTTMKFTVEIFVAIGLILAFVRPKWLLYFLIFSLLEPSRSFSLGNYVILGTINVKYYEITLTLIYFAALWNQKRELKDCLPISVIIFIFFAIISLWKGSGIYGESAFNQFRTFYSLGMCIAIPLIYKDSEELKPLLKVFLFTTMFMGLIELLGLKFNFISSYAFKGVRYTSLLSATQGAILAMPYIYIISTLRFYKHFKVPTLAAAVYCFLIAVATGSRGVLLGLIGSTAGLVLLMPVKKKIVIIFVIFLLGVFSFVFAKSFYIKRYEMTLAERFSNLISTKENTARWRLDAWSQMIEDIREKPLLGTPFGTPSVFHVYDAGIEEHAPHNEYLKIARYTGLFGFSAFMWFLLGIFITGFNKLRDLGESKEYYELTGFLICFLFHVITAMFTQAFTTMDRSPIVWGIAGIIILYTLQNNPTESTAYN